jgi:hypothetical protein
MFKARGLVSALALAVCGVSSFGCSEKEKGTDEGREVALQNAAAASFVEQFERGSVAWNVNANGQVLARIQDDSGKDISKDVKGTIAWSEGNDTRTAPLEWDAEHGALGAKGPALQTDLTELRYTLITDGEPVSGALHVPAAGTAELNADAEASTKISVAGAVAPHGGVIQVVGDDRLEIVADDDSDEVRVYLLDPTWKPVVGGGANITIAVGGAKPEVVVLTPSADGVFFVGRWHVVGEPPRLTVCVKRPGRVRVAIVGWHPGAKIHVGGGPKVKVKVKGGVVFGGPKVDVKVKGGGPAMVKIDVKDHGPKGKAKIKFK